MMSNDPSPTQPCLRGSRNPQSLESNENEYESSTWTNPIHAHVHPVRSPLNSIPDPAQLRRDLESDSDVSKLDGAEGSEFFNDKTSISSSEGLMPVGKWVSVSGLASTTPKVISGRGKHDSEAISAQSTPARSAGFRSLGVGSRVYQSNGRKIGGSSRHSRRFTIVNTDHAEPVVDVPHFELEDDPLFWKDHNVQVLIRIRPLNNMERVLQGQARCLKQESAQTLAWLGHPETRFTFDHIVCETITQEKLFRVAGLPMVENCMYGYNSCIFAYGQTGSGKTFTMMGEVHEVKGNLNQDCGITPRIFEYLFTRIKAEEESRRDEKLTYSCRCSFLEIYNEQITDLLEPSSTNLQLREDFKKGVHVENLTECNVRTVNDVLQLLLKGTANRKIAATNMNSESSRSHSVFTCIIESRWEKDSLTHSRYGRLNLVDLAGSERQKSSGAEGDRLREAANINRSLSTLGLVIMSLVDVAHGKHRHVPYRDSRLTFLLQDSLGGNSKTTIIANVSPSFCSATETLSTLKFAQRAKLIQNNAKVNEDASGDVTALQEQVQQLKEQLSQLLNRQGQPTTPLLKHGDNRIGAADFSDNSDPTVGGSTVYKQELRNANDKIKCLESALARSSRKEKTAQNTIKKLEAELEHMRLTGTMSTRSDHGYGTSNDLVKDRICHGDDDCQIDGMSSMQSTEISEESSDAQLLIEALERDNIRMMQELQVMEERNQQLLDSLGGDDMQKALSLCSNKPSMEVQVLHSQNRSLVRAAHEDSELLSLQAKLEKMARDLEQARLLNIHYQEDEALKLHHQKDVELVHEQVEMETANTIIHLQDEIASLQVDLREKLCCMTVENNKLKSIIADKDGALRTLSAQWERATLELTSFLMDGSKSLNHASSRIRSMACLFPHDNLGLGENIESAAKVCMEKEEMILHLQKSLEDAQKTVFEMERKLNSLKGAAIAFTGAQHLMSTGSSEELSDAGTNDVKTMNCRSGFSLMNEVDEDPEALLSELRLPSRGCSLEHDIEKLPRIANSTTCANQLISDTGVHLNDMAFGGSELLVDLNERRRCFPFGSTDMPSYESSKGSKPIHQFQVICCIKEELAEITTRLRSIQASADKMVETYVGKWETNSVTSDSSLSISDVSLEEIRPPSPSAAEYMLDQVCEHGPSPLLLDVEPQKISTPPELPEKHQRLMLIEELEMASRAFSDLCDSLNAIIAHLGASKEPERKRFLQNWDVVVNDNLCEYNSGNKEQRISGMTSSHQSCSTGTIAYLNSSCGNKIFALDGKVEQGDSFFSKFEEAYSTMQEADVMLNALVKSNESAKRHTHMWGKVGKELKGERDCLLDQVQHLESKLCLKESEDDILDDERSSLLEVTQSVSSLVDCFVDLQNHSEELFKGVHSDVLSISTYFHNYFGSLRDTFEQICSELIQKDFSTLVLHMCLTDYMNRIQNMRVERELPSVVIDARDASSFGAQGRDRRNKTAALPMLEVEESVPQPDYLSHENSQLRKELARKEVVLEGLLFDFSLLQEAASNRKDIRDEINKLIMALGQAEHELQVKKQQLDDVILQVGEVEDCLADTRHALSISSSKLEQTQRSLDILSSQKYELSLCLKDLHRQKSEVENQLVEKDEIIKGLEKEIIHLTSAVSGRDMLSMESVEDDLMKVTIERDQLCEEIKSLKEKMELAYAIAEENEALALEARQDSETSKIYAEQKQEEVTILESSIEELENTVNVLEQKVTEMDEEVQKHQLDRVSLETEVQALRQRLMTVENFTGNVDSGDPIDEKLGNSIPRQFKNQCLGLDQAYARIKVIEKIRTEQAKELDRMKEYVSELVLHAEAQASQHQAKYKSLEAMVCELRKNSSSTVPFMPVLDKSERSSSRPRGSSSPFRCISNLVHQMHMEKDQELLTARDRIEELELLAASRQKEVCMLSSRLAAAESMTHDVIRDLLGLKLDMTNYADLVDQHQLHSLLDVAQRKIMESKEKDEEIHRLQAQVADLVNERDSCFTEINRREANNLAAQLTLEQLRERDQYLTVQNELLKVEKTNLMHRPLQLENMVRETERHKAQRHLERPLKIKDNQAMRDHSSLRRRTLLPGELLSHVNNDHTQNRIFEGNSHHDQRKG